MLYGIFQVITKTAISERSSYYLEDGSYLRLNTITLGYTLPKKLVQRAKNQ